MRQQCDGIIWKAEFLVFQLLLNQLVVYVTQTFCFLLLIAEWLVTAVGVYLQCTDIGQMTKNALKYTVPKNRQISESLGKQVPWRRLVILENKASLPRITKKFPL